MIYNLYELDVLDIEKYNLINTMDSCGRERGRIVLCLSYLLHLKNNQSYLAAKGLYEIYALDQQAKFPQNTLSISFPILQGGLV